MSRGQPPGLPSNNPGWRRMVQRQFYARVWAEHGSLYGELGSDECEAQAIRDECNAMGLPMGYGRVSRAPIQLSDTEARTQFRVRNKRR